MLIANLPACKAPKRFLVEELQEILPENTMLLEYYTARNRFYVCLVSRKQFKIVALGDVNGVGKSCVFYSCNWPNFVWDRTISSALEKALLEATQAHLEELYALLIAPIRDQLTAEHLIIVPHAFLHYLPFHALSDGKRLHHRRFFRLLRSQQQHLCCLPGKAVAGR